MSRHASLARVLGALVLGTFFPGTPSRAAAEPSSDVRALLRIAADASRAKKWDACIEAYSRALAIEESAITFGELGLCEEAAGRFASAHPHLKRAAAGLPPGDERRERYQAALGQVADQVAIVIVTTTPTEARLVVDGHPLGLGEGRHVAVEPGKHVFSARLAGYADVSKTITVNARELPHLALSLAPLAAATSPAAPSAAPLHTPPTAQVAEAGLAMSLPLPFRWCVPAWSARGVLAPAACLGAAALAASGGAAIGLAVHWQSMRDSLLARGYTPASCGAGPAAAYAECEELYSRWVQRNTARDVLIGTGIAAGALVGMAGLAIGLEPPGPRITPTASADGGGVVVQGTW